MNWYYVSAGKQQGPVDDTDLSQLLAERKITADTLVWRDGLSEWTRLHIAKPETVAALLTASSANSASESPQPGWVRCSLTGRYFPPSEIITIEGKPYSAAAKPQVVASLEHGDPLPTAESEGARTGPAWEQRQTLGMWKAIARTCKDVLFAPTATFATMKREGGLRSPFIFTLIVGSITGIVAQLASGVPELITSGGKANAGEIIGGIIAIPFILAIAAFINPAITHVMLVFLKATNRPFETTFRALNYASGGIAPAQMAIEILTTLIALVGLRISGSEAATLANAGTFPLMFWYCYVSIVAVAETHEISRRKAAAAVLLPLLLCCSAVAFIVAVCS
jgi:hypothetical protein